MKVKEYCTLKEYFDSYEELNKRYSWPLQIIVRGTLEDIDALTITNRGYIVWYRDKLTRQKKTIELSSDTLVYAQ